MGERQPLGILKVTVARGKRLVIRGFKSSDPYVVLKLGNQVSVYSSLILILGCVLGSEISVILA